MVKKKGCKDGKNKDEKKEETPVVSNLFDYEIRMVLSKLWWSQKNFTDPVTKFHIIPGPGNAKELPEKLSHGMEHAILSGILLPVEPRIEIIRKEKSKGNYNGC